MDTRLKFKAKRSWEGSSNNEIEDAAQVKFKRLLERNQASKIPRDFETQEDVKNTVLKLVDDNLSFEGILSESEGLCSWQCDSLQEKFESDALSSLAVSVESSVQLLKCQAVKASCPLDLLAAESLARMLQTLLSSDSDQLLTNKRMESVLSILKVIKHMLSEQCFNRVSFTKHLTGKGASLPLEVAWMLHKECIVSFDTYLACCVQHIGTVDMMSRRLIALCSCTINKEKQETILSVILGRLVTFAFLENKAKEGMNNRLEELSQEVLDVVIEKSDFLACRKITEARAADKEDEDSICLLEIIRRLNDIPWSAIRKFFTRQLNMLFAKQRDDDTPAIYHIVCNQKKLKFSALNKTAKTVFEQFLLVFEPLTVMEYVKNALNKDQVNLEDILSFIATFTVLVKEAASLIEGYVTDLLNDSLNNNNSRCLRVAFLVIRQISLEGGHVFQPYVTWFQGTFGDQGNVKLTNKKSVQSFMKFLSDLVPYENPEYLKVHIIKPPQVPTKFRELVTDYVSLAKTRLMDLKEPVELMGIYQDSSVSSGAEAKSDHRKQLEQASADVEKVLESYEKSGKVPSTVMEASIFRKPYFIGRFLPALLTPRKVPDEPDSRAQFIDVLSKAGKITKNMLSAYQSACEKITTEQIEVSSSDDEGTLSGMEKLVSSLEKFTKIVVESIKSADLKESGRMSPQLSIISATIQALVKSSNENLVANQFVEMDVKSTEKNSSEALKVVDALLEGFCHTCAAVNSCAPESLDHVKRYQWVPDFVAMLASLSSLHQSLYCQLWSKLCCKGVQLNKEDAHGLAVFLCHLSTHQSTILPVLLKGIDRLVENNVPGVFTICSFVDILCEYVPLWTSRWMEFFHRYSSSYLQHALQVFDVNATELKANVGRHTVYVSPAMLKKMLYLFHRLNVFGETDFFTPTLPADVVCTGRNLNSLQQFHLWKGKECKLTFSEWCHWELNISAADDFLPDTDRRIYHRYRVLDHYLPLGSLQGGCDGCARKACSVIFGALLDSYSRCPQGRHDPDASRNDMICLLQELIPLLPQRSGGAVDVKSAETTCDPWLQEQLLSRLAEVQSKLDKSESKTSQNYELLQASEVASFMKLAMRLPPYLLFTDLLAEVPQVNSTKRVAAFINSYLRSHASDRCCLPFDVTLYIFKALLSYTRGSLSPSRTPSGSQLLTLFFQDCPLLFVSVQHYWKQLKPFATIQHDITNGPFRLAELLMNWKNRAENDQNVSLRELESFDVCVVACCITMNLRWINSKIMALLEEEINSPRDFTRQLTVCLLDSIMAEFSQMLVDGREIGEDSLLKEFARKLFESFPKTLLVFKLDGQCDYKEDLHRLRSLILKDQLLRLYPAVFFSFFSNLPSEALRKMVTISGFLESTLCMYNSFVYLRKQCLDGVANKTAVCSPLDLDFCRQVSVFVRDCVLSSPVENLRNLPKDVIMSCTSELRQFLQTRLSKFQER